jgi:hypothetical protein
MVGEPVIEEINERLRVLVGEARGPVSVAILAQKCEEVSMRLVVYFSNTIGGTLGEWIQRHASLIPFRA